MMTEETNIEDVSDSSYTTVKSSDSELDEYSSSKYNKQKWSDSMHDWGELVWKKQAKKGELNFVVPLIEHESMEEDEGTLSYYGNEKVWNSIAQNVDREISITPRKALPKVKINRTTENSVKSTKKRHGKAYLKEKYVGLKMAGSKKKFTDLAAQNKIERESKVNEVTQAVYKKKLSLISKDISYQNQNMRGSLTKPTKSKRHHDLTMNRKSTISNKKPESLGPDISSTNDTNDSSSSTSPIPSVSKRHPSRKRYTKKRSTVVKRKGLLEKKKQNDSGIHPQLKISSASDRKEIKEKKHMPKRVSFQPDMVEVVSFDRSENSKESDIFKKQDQVKEDNHKIPDNKENAKKLGAMTPERAETIKNFYKDWAKKPRRTENLRQERHFLAMKKLEIRHNVLNHLDYMLTK